MLTFKEFFSEEIGIDNEGKLSIHLADGIKSSFGKDSKLTPFRKKIEGSSPALYSYSLYNSEKNVDIVKAIKAMESTPEYEKFITRSAIYASRILRQLNVEVIVTPISSSSLTKDFASELSKRSHVDFFIDSFEKQKDINNLTVDRSHPNITDDLADSIQKTVDKAKNTGKFSIKSLHPKHRKFIRNLFDVVNQKILNKIENKSVLIIDDVMTSGTTAINIQDILIRNGAKEITVLTIFKS